MMRTDTLSDAAPLALDTDTQNESAWRVLLARLPEMTPRRFGLLYERFGSSEKICLQSAQAWNADLRLSWEAGQAAELLKTLQGVDPIKEIEKLKKRGVWTLIPENPAYPALLKEIADPPFILFGLGDQALLTQRQLAVVGTRRPSENGLRVTKLLCEQMGSAQFVITSGMAAGIDGAAHVAALQSGAGTVAVLGHGVDLVYPANHARLYKDLCQKGCVISEYPLGQRGTAWSYPRRNRIISGLSVGTLVIEAGEQSGALITAKHALEQNREVFAVPGSPLASQSVGTNRLIQQGAKLVIDVADILAEFSYVGETSQGVGGIQPFRAAAPARDPLNDTAVSDPGRRLWQALGGEALTLEKLSKRAALPPSTVAAELSVLEIQGYIQRHEGGSFSRA